MSQIVPKNRAKRSCSMFGGSMEFSRQHTSKTSARTTETAMIQTMAMPHSSSYHLTNAMKHTTAYAPAHHARNVTAIIHSPERNPMLCRYPSKLCDMLRSEKRGGGLHRFCAYHRERANINQRRVDHRRRLRKQGLPVPPVERAPSHWQTDDERMQHQTIKVESEMKQEQDDEEMTTQDVDLFDVGESAAPLLADFSSSDLQELMELLDDVDTTTELIIKEETTDPRDAGGPCLV